MKKLHDNVSTECESSGVRVSNSSDTSARALVHRVIEEIWNRGDLELADALFSPDYVNHGGLIPDLLRGPEGIKLSVVLYRSAFPGFQVSVDGLTTEEDTIVIRWVAHSNAPPIDPPAAGKRGLRGITRCRIRDGQVAESWTVWDSRQALVRLSAVTRDAENSNPRSEHPLIHKSTARQKDD